MKKNMGSFDKAVRILVAVAIIALYYTKQINGTAAIILMAVAPIFIVTSFISVCPIYLMFGISTKSKKKAIN
jgi:hypothetical protein